MAKPAPRIMYSAVAGAVVLSASGCGYLGVNRADTQDPYAPADGVIVELGDLRATNLLIVSTDADAPGRLLGSLANDGTRPLTVSVETAADAVRIPVPADSTVLLEDIAPVILDPTGVEPGLMAETRFTTGNDSAVEPVPVLDHTFPRYAEFVPGWGTASPDPGSGAPSSPAGQSPENGAEDDVTLTGTVGTVVSPVAFTLTGPGIGDAPLLVISFDAASAGLEAGMPVAVVGAVHDAYNVPDTEENLGESPGPEVLAHYDGRPYVEARSVQRAQPAPAPSA